MKKERDRFPREQLHMIVDKIEEPYLQEAIQVMEGFMGKSESDTRRKRKKK